MKKLLVLPILFLALYLTTVPAHGQKTAPPPAPGIFTGGGPAALFGDARHLYVMVGGKLFEYTLATMTLEHSATLPACSHPPMPFPLPPPPPQGLWAGNGKVYVLWGPAVYVYEASGLRLENTVELPGPKPPQAGRTH
ncbi:MAG: hypothetical protein P4L43_09730 [Syntrophobacteraceae bacterium]|nr:hypothetical protein [Syntrophobacteraceae bacterium]